MLNLTVHLVVRGVPDDLLDDDAFLDALFRELPDAALSGSGGAIAVTLSQSAFSTQRGGERQRARAQRAAERSASRTRVRRSSMRSVPASATTCA